MTAFPPLDPRASAVDACTRAIEDAILEGRLAPGDKLPAERELAVQLGVARLTLRAALARLGAAGLILAKHGSGTVVQDVARHASPAMIGNLARAAVARGDLAGLAADLLTIRRSLASAVLERLAEIAVPARAVSRLEAAVDRMAAAAARPGVTSAEIADADHDVVAALVAASGLEVASLFLNPVFTALRELPALRDAVYTDPADNVIGWRGVVVWLRTRPRRTAPLLEILLHRDARTVSRLRATKRTTRTRR